MTDKKERASFISKAALKSKGYVDTAELAHISGISKTYVRALARLGPKKGGIPSIKYGARWFFHPAEVDEALCKVNGLDIEQLEDADTDAADIERLNSVYETADDL